jgi:diguanylate cyclase (GGDEF)-like protein
MARQKPKKPPSGKYILVIDDDQDIVNIIKNTLNREGHSVTIAFSGEAALKLLHHEYFDLIILDYLMPNMDGEQFLKELRKFNPYIQVILYTAFAGNYPPREMLKRLDIQGYCEKGDNVEELLLWVDAGLKAANTFNTIIKSRQGLEYILNATTALYKIQPLDDLLQNILILISGLLGASDTFLAVLPTTQTEHFDAFLAMLEKDIGLEIRAATGRFADQKRVDILEASEIKVIYNAIQSGKIQTMDNYCIIPLGIGAEVIGIVFFGKSINDQQDLELLQVFAKQAAVAVYNIHQIHSLAINDPLTGAYVRGFFDKCLLRELYMAFRSQKKLCLLMIDMDKLKHINDTAGHTEGDQALTIMGRILHAATRNSDYVCRYGGDEFAIILPLTSVEGAFIVGKMILELLRDKNIQGPNGPIPVRVSIGIGELGIMALDPKEISSIPHSYFEQLAKQFINQADKMLYQAKQKGGYCICVESNIEWPKSDPVP